MSNREEMQERARHLERLLKKKLSEFLDSSVLYAMRRVLPAELNTIYVKNFVKENTQDTEKPALNPELERLLPKEAKTNEAKGGIKITDYLTYNW